jgi:hypothetical protein
MEINMFYKWTHKLQSLLRSCKTVTSVFRMNFELDIKRRLWGSYHRTEEEPVSWTTECFRNKSQTRCRLFKLAVLLCELAFLTLVKYSLSVHTLSVRAKPNKSPLVWKQSVVFVPTETCSFHSWEIMFASSLQKIGEHAANANGIGIV